MNVENTARTIKEAVASLSVTDTATLRSVRKDFSKQIRGAAPGDVIELARALIRRQRLANFIAYELIQHHPRAARALTETDLSDLVTDLDSWWTVDAFACYLSGVAWRERQVSDEFIYSWARS